MHEIGNKMHKIR